MNLAATISIYSGGPGSGCNPAMGDCGRKGSTTFYHGTTKEAAKKILKEGLKPGHRSAYGFDKILEEKQFAKLNLARKGSVYLTLTPQRAKFYATQTGIGRKASSIAVVKFDIPNRMAAKFTEDWLDMKRSFTHEGAIPVKHIVSLLEPDKMVRGGWKETKVE